jgi:hypothetical protein
MPEVPKGRGFAPSARWDYFYSRGRTYFSKAVEPIPTPKETSANRNENIRLLVVASDRNIRLVKKRRKTNAMRLLHVSAVKVVTIPRACDLDPGAVRQTIPATTKSANSGILYRSAFFGEIILFPNVPDDQSPLASGVLPAREADQQEA